MCVCVCVCVRERERERGREGERESNFDSGEGKGVVQLAKIKLNQTLNTNRCEMLLSEFGSQSCR